MALNWPVKDPNDVKDYVLDWTAAMAADDEIVGAEWFVTPSGELTIDSDTVHNDTEQIAGSDGTIITMEHFCRVWLSGGEDGERYSLLCRVTTDDGRVMDQTVRIRVRQR